MVLEGVTGVVFKRSDERKKRKYFEKGAKDSMGEVSAKVFLGSVVVLSVRSKQVAVVDKRRGECGDRVGRAES